MWISQDNVNSPLYVVTALFNPVRFKSRWQLYRDFAKRVTDAGAKLITIEAAFGEREHAVLLHAPMGGGNQYIQLRVAQDSELWLKENLQDIAVSRLPTDAKYVAFMDADLSWARPDIFTETLHALQHFDVVQMYSHLIAAGPNHEPLSAGQSFGYVHVNGVRANAKAELSAPGAAGANAGKQWGIPGGAWAWRRSALNAVGGFIDFAILGAADYYMAHALVGDAEGCLNAKYTPGYRNPILQWQERAEDKIKRNIGYIDGALWHHWHGSYSSRYYGTRASILIDNAFDPATDLAYDSQGVIQLTGKKPKLRDDIRSYFRLRDEDSTHVPGTDYQLVAPKPVPAWNKSSTGPHSQT